MAGRPPLTDAPTFGKRLAAARRNQGLSQEALAKLLGTTRVNLGYYERKATNPTLDFIQRCAEVLSVSAAYLIGATDDPASKQTVRKPGPPSDLERLAARLQALPRPKRKVVIQMLEGALSKA